MKNDVFTTKEYLIYVINEPAKVDAVKHMLYRRANFSDLRILDHRDCCGGKYYVWHIQSWDAMFLSIKDSLRSFIHEGVCSKNEIKIVEDYHGEEA